MSERVNDHQLKKYIDRQDMDRSDPPEWMEFDNLCLDLQDARDKMTRIGQAIDRVNIMSKADLNATIGQICMILDFDDPPRIDSIQTKIRRRK